MATETKVSAIAADSKLKTFFVDQLQDIYWTEQKLTKTIPKLMEAATNNDLKQAIRNHLEETQGHVKLVEKVFSLIGETATPSTSPAMSGIVEESEEILDETDESTAQRDVGIIFVMQKAEHYEIATYGGLVALAKTLGYNDAADVLKKILMQEKEIDAMLTKIAETKSNYQASLEPRKS